MEPHQGTRAFLSSHAAVCSSVMLSGFDLTDDVLEVVEGVLVEAEAPPRDARPFLGGG